MKVKDILFQLDICWQLFEYHITNLSEEEAMWCISENGLKVFLDGTWKVDWPETEVYEIGPASIAWTLWHILYWWQSVISASFYNRVLIKEDVKWPGTVNEALDEIKKCHEIWIKEISSMNDNELEMTDKCKWPFENESFKKLCMWLNIELMKNVSEIGMGRFLYAVSKSKI